MHIDKEHEIPFECCTCDKIPKTKYILIGTLIKSMESFGCCACDKIPETKFISKCTLIKSMKTHFKIQKSLESHNLKLCM